MRKRDLLILLAALTAAAVTAVGIFSGSALPTGSWGLSFRQEGAPPIGNAGIDQLKRYDAAYIGNTSEKVLYLTFDAGYENGCTEKILDTLQKHNVKAAFFLVLPDIFLQLIPGSPEIPTGTTKTCIQDSRFFHLFLDLLYNGNPKMSCKWDQRQYRKEKYPNYQLVGP